MRAALARQIEKTLYNKYNQLEASELAAAAIELDVVQSLGVSLARIRPSTYLGKGRVEEIAGLIRAEEIGLVVMDCALSTRRRVPPSCRTARQ